MCNYNSFPFTLRDVARLCGISTRGSKENENVTCPFCGRKRKMNFKYSTSQYNCPACNTGGHMLSLYAKLNGMEDKTNAEITAAIKEQLNIPADEITPMRNEQPVKDEPAKVDFSAMFHADKVYRSFLSKLQLADMHREALYDRGLTDGDIEKWRFRSVPVCGLDSIVNGLVRNGISPKGVAGFYVTENGQWSINLNTSTTGFIVPAHNIYGCIEGLQIRLDRPFGKQKYLWVSSDGLQNGTKAEATPFFAGGSRCRNTLIITEGAFKAIIPSKYCGYSVLGIAGVNNQKAIKKIVPEIKHKGYTRIMEAFDADFAKNNAVRKAKAKLKSLMTENGFNYEVFEWDLSQGKGLDDYVLKKLKERNK